MRFFFDENMPPTLPQALNILHRPAPGQNVDVTSISEFLYPGVPDEEWIPAIREEGPATVVTCDYQLHRRTDQKLLYQENELGLIVLRPNSKRGMPYWDQVKYIIKHWEEILEVEESTPKPYLFLLKVTGNPELIYDGRNWRDV